MNEMTISQQIATIGGKLKYEDIPQEVTENAKKFMLDLLACIIGAKEVGSSKA
jgi:2-methylcitrate dehydratase PrpD